MNVINFARGNGKTTAMIQTAYVTGYPIICGSETHKRYIEEMAFKIFEKDEDVKYKVKVFTLAEWEKCLFKHNFEHVLIDEADYIIGVALTKLLEVAPIAYTTTCPMIDFKSRNDNGGK